MSFRDRAVLPKLGPQVPRTNVLLDTIVFINALTGRGPAALRTLLEDLSRAFVVAPTLAELAWVLGRLVPDHPGTQRILTTVAAASLRIDPSKVLVPAEADWRRAGELAGHAARMVAGGGRRLATAFDRAELISDALRAIAARAARLTIVTEDADFDVFSQLLPGLDVLSYDRE